MQGYKGGPMKNLGKIITFFVILFPIGYTLYLSFTTDFRENILFGIFASILGIITFKIVGYFYNWAFDYEGYLHPSEGEFNFLLFWIVVSHFAALSAILIYLYSISFALFGAIFVFGVLFMKRLIEDFSEISNLYNILRKLPRF